MSELSDDKNGAAEELARSEERLRFLVESVKDYAIFMLDTTGRVVSWNSGASRIKGYSASEIIGQHFSIFYPDADARSGKCEMELVAAERDGRFEDEGWRVRKGGSLFWANVVITAIRNADQELIGFVKVTRDLTERRRAEDERLRLAQAQESNRVKDEFLATMSHELRTPLNAILGWSTILATKAKDAETFKIAETIRRNAQSQARLIEDLLDVSRIITGTLRLDVRPIDLRAIVTEAVEVVRPAADARGITIVKKNDVPIAFVGDPTRLQQVIWNLLSNAVKFTGNGGEIFVEVEQRGSSVHIVVRDTGEGIDPLLLGHVFERFRQADASTTRTFGGLGLGLAIVRQIVELHGGEVSAASAGRGKGASFEVRLPIRALLLHGSAQPSDVRSTTETVISAAPTSRLDGLKVLVVDDEPDARDLLVTLLSDQGAKVCVTASAAEARQVLPRQRPDVLVSDIGMPGEDGYDLMRSIRALPAELGGGIPSVALTAYARTTDRKRAIDAGFDDYVAKPVDPEKLLAVLRDLGSTALR